MRSKKIVIANWKMNPATLREAQQLFTSIARRAGRNTKANIIICPPDLYLGALANGYSGSKVAFGAQNISILDEMTGSYTGELSARMLRKNDIGYTIIGHSERRALGETDEDIAKKVTAAVGAKIKTVVCVGEHERDMNGDYLAFVRHQVRSAFSGISRDDARYVVLAYEPLWAIGKTAADAVTPDALHQITLFLRKTLIEFFGRKKGGAIPIVYGGSVEPSNAAELATIDVVSGFLVGHASLSSQDFAEIVKAVVYR